MTEPRTPRTVVESQIDHWRMQARLSDGGTSSTFTHCADELEEALRIEAEAEAGAAPPIDVEEALTLLRMANPRMAVGGAAADAWLGEVAVFLKDVDARLAGPPPEPKP